MKYYYKTPCSKKQLYNIRQFLAGHLRETTMSSKECHQIVLAVDEACANAIIHGNQCDSNRELQVELSITKKQVAIEIYDVGNYFPDESALKWSDQNLQNSIRNKQKGGLGLRLIHCIMDHVKYYQRGKDKVNVCSLVKEIKTI